MILKLLLSVSTDRAKEKEYGDLSDAQRAEVDGRVLRVRNNVAMKALNVELKRLNRRRVGRKHHSTHLSGFTIHEQEEGKNVSALLPAFQPAWGRMGRRIGLDSDRQTLS